MSLPIETRWSLVHAAAEGDADAGRVFAETYLGIVRAFLLERWRGRPELVGVDDALQEVFLDFFKEGGALQRARQGGGKGFRSFLFGVVHKVALRHEERLHRETRRRAGAPPDSDLPEDPRHAASRVFDRSWAHALIERARARLVSQARNERESKRVELLRLRFAEDLPIRTIAERWDEDAAHLHHEYAKAREAFKIALREEIAHTCAVEGRELDGECRTLLELLE